MQNWKFHITWNFLKNVYICHVFIAMKKNRFYVTFAFQTGIF